eukprot:1377072-Rhodomonas_salina.1
MSSTLPPQPAPEGTPHPTMPTLLCLVPAQQGTPHPIHSYRSKITLLLVAPLTSPTKYPLPVPIVPAQQGTAHPTCHATMSIITLLSLFALSTSPTRYPSPYPSPYYV